MFQRLALAFGNQLAAKWSGMDMNAVYDDWAEALADCSMGGINYAIEQSKSADHPPSQGEFLKHCRQYRPSDVLKLESKLTPEQIEKNRRRIAEIAEGLAKKAAA